MGVVPATWWVVWRYADGILSRTSGKCFDEVGFPDYDTARDAYENSKAEVESSADMASTAVRHIYLYRKNRLVKAWDNPSQWVHPSQAQITEPQ